MCNNQIIATIYEMMKFNKVSLEELIEFIDNQKKSYNTYSYDKNKKWGDEAVELDFINSQQTAEEQEKQVEEEQENTTSWVSVIKKSKTNHSENVKKPQIVKSQVVKQNVVKQQSKEKDECFVIYTVDDFIQCVKEKKKLHIDFTIDPESHCEHTFNGTICNDVKECGKIHVQRCMNNLDCKYQYCQFLHVDEMPDDEAKENYMDSMDKYNKIKKNKKVYV
jgi:hypothetical protein